MSFSREYDFILLGATGYTGRLCAEYITTQLPTNIKWAVAGRSASKLQDLVNNVRKLNSNRLQPAIRSVQFEKDELALLAKSTKLLLNCVGPYYLYSTPVVEACAENGTHYLDATGETPWVREIISKYHKIAERSNAILIPEIAVESSPSDLIAYIAASIIRKSLNCGVLDVTSAVHELKSAGPSGGTLTTALGILDHYSTAEIRASLGDPFSLSPTPPPHRPSTRSMLSRAIGVFSYPGLGILTTYLGASPNVAIVHRSAGLMPQLYGPNFRYVEYMRVSNYAIGAIAHIGIAIAMLLLAIPPLRRLLKRLVYQPGFGPEVGASTKDVLEYRAIATPDKPGTQKRAMARFRFEGGVYHLTALFLAEAAMVLLKEDELVKQLGGGVLTPACLGDKFIERLQRANVELSGEMIDG